jgi:hypothetical protein
VRVLSIALFAMLLGCASAPESYPVPPQHDPAPGPARLARSDYVQADDPGAEGFFKKDVQSLEGRYRWTRANPEFRFVLTNTENRTFKLEFGVNPLILKEVGPLEMTILVNQQPLATVRYATAGDKVFEKRVPKSWLVLNGDNLVNIRVHKPWPAPDKGIYLGFVFYGAGFIE